LAASSAYLTPIAHQAHLLVMSAGGYSFSDFTKVGIGIWSIALVTIILLLPLFFPLFP
jgi:di/tricarboxylate transporter